MSNSELVVSWIFRLCYWTPLAPLCWEYYWNIHDLLPPRAIFSLFSLTLSTKQLFSFLTQIIIFKTDSCILHLLPSKMNLGLMSFTIITVDSSKNYFWFLFCNIILIWLVSQFLWNLKRFYHQNNREGETLQTGIFEDMNHFHIVFY